MKPWTSSYLDIPYLDGGRTREGADCFGLYAIILTERVGLVLPDYEESWGKGADGILQRIATEIATGNWLKIEGDPVKVARELDCVRLTGHAKGSDGIVRRAAVHLGCAIGNGKVIHSEDVRGPRITHMGDSSICRRIEGVYRLKSLCSQ